MFKLSLNILLGLCQSLKAGSEFGRVGGGSATLAGDFACAGFLQAGERGIGIFGAAGGDVFHPAPCVFEQQQMNAFTFQWLGVVGAL